MPSSPTPPDETPAPLSASEKQLSFLVPPQAPGELGRLGPYRVLKLLGAGGMGVVFLAEDTALSRPVALKVLKAALQGDAGARQRFLREANAAARLRHDHVVTIYQVGEDRGAPYLAMELLEGETLEDRLRRQGALPVAEAVQFARETAEALAEAHRAGLVYRDLKPSNLWIEKRAGRAQRIKVLDFGLARQVTAGDTLTQSGAVMGTPQYMSPEQARGEPPDQRGDLFSLGSVLYHMLTGGCPFTGANLRAILRAVLFDAPRPPASVNPAVPTGLSDFVMRLLAKEPGQRPQSADEVVKALSMPEQPRADALATLEWCGAPETLVRGPQRHRRRWLLPAAAATMLAGLASAWLLGAFSPSRPPGSDPPSSQGTGPLDPTRPAAPAGPFVVVGPEGKAGAGFRSLAEAAEAARSGDAIEVHGDGPFPCEPILVSGKDLIVRAATGSRPRLRFIGAHEDGGCLVAHRRLVLEGLEIESQVKPVDKPITLVGCYGQGNLHLAHCRVLFRGQGMEVQSDARRLRARACEFLGGDALWYTITWYPPPDGEAVLEGCVFRGRGRFEAPGALHMRLVKLFPDHAVRLRHNTFLSITPLSVVIYRPALERPGKGNLLAEDNVFPSNRGVIQYGTWPDFKDAVLAGEGLPLLPKLYAWQEERNVYVAGAPFLTGWDGQKLLEVGKDVKSLEDWRARYWKLGATSSVRGEIHFSGPFSERQDLEKITSGQFRLGPGSAGKGMAPGGRDAGADVDAVGPGPAYDAWRVTPDYRQWLVETGQLK